MRYALNSLGTLVPADEPCPGPFSCLRCESPAHVRLSPHQRPHFVHTRGAECELRRDRLPTWPAYRAMLTMLDALYAQQT
jgi:hypothetical protein